jgi:hypothetical protein
MTLDVRLPDPPRLLAVFRLHPKVLSLGDVVLLWQLPVPPRQLVAPAGAAADGGTATRKISLSK